MKRYLFPIVPILAASAVCGLADDLAILSDEFDDPATLSDWQRLNEAEGWNADKLEVHDVDTSVPGQMRIMPYTTSWYMDLTGPLVFKEVSGDFVVTLHLDARRRNGQPGRPVGTFSLGGIMIRTPRAIENANPQPDAAPGVALPWPPAGYTTDWTPDGENYIFLSYGNTDGSAAPDQWNYEVKTTIDGNSTLYYDDQGVPAGTGVVTLQAVRMGSTFVVMRKHPDGEWIIENRYDRPGMPATLQVGITAYTDWGNITANGLFQSADEHAGPFHHNHNVITAANGFAADPDLVVDAEYFRYARPPQSLTVEQLEALPLTSDGAGLQLLNATPLADVLGDAVNQPYLPPGPDPLDPPSDVEVLGGEFRVTVNWTPFPEAAEYAVFRNTIANATGSIELGRVDGATRSYQDETAELGTGYFYSVQAIAVGGAAGENSSWYPGGLSTVPDYRPDALIGKKVANKIGGGIYQEGGSGQTIRLKSPRRKALRFFVRLENDGAMADILRVAGTLKNRHFQIRIVHNQPGGGRANVTAAVSSGSFAPEAEAGEGVELGCRVKRRGPRTGSRKRRTFKIMVTSQQRPERRDVVRAKVESR